MTPNLEKNKKLMSIVTLKLSTWHKIGKFLVLATNVSKLLKFQAQIAWKIIHSFNNVYSIFKDKIKYNLLIQVIRYHTNTCQELIHYISFNLYFCALNPFFAIQLFQLKIYTKKRHKLQAVSMKRTFVFQTKTKNIENTCHTSSTYQYA